MTDSKDHWERIYRDKSPYEVSWYQNVPRLSLALIENSGVTRDAPIIDVGGGASKLVDRLHRHGYTRLAVLDIAAAALQHARERMGDAAHDIEWYEADATRFQPPHAFALWHDRAVFHFLVSAEDRGAYVDVLTRSLQPKGQLIIAAFAIGGPLRCSGLDIVQYDAAKLNRELGPGFELVEQCAESHLTPAGKKQAFGYYRFVKR